MRRRELLWGMALGLQAPALAAAAPLPLRRRISLVHNDLNYTAFIDIPAGEAPIQGWPLILVLDGNAYFETMVSAVRTQAFVPAWTSMPEAVVVGIDQAGGGLFGSARTFDYTPAPLKSPDAAKPTGGGADAFHAFLMRELLPQVSTDVRIDPARRMLFGHSLGGLFVLHTLFRHPESFFGYGASSPSIWWADRAILEERQQFLRSPPTAAKRLLISVGEWEARLSPDAKAAPGQEERQKMLQDGAMVGNAKEMADILGEVTNLKVRYDFHAKADHLSVPFAAIPLAARFIFADQQ
ncbi:alpha/beta hydrolase [Sandaracinobacter neustonicus]|uniref:Alpha/beta hydrolase n=1 Tax=Sandaracinobacter neustonicus TaxID=1715348 RepID=A0A501XIL9_9SPHN|nr:alpha/beta hydrolase-fold protein [Sandaracinobacter neustonicus]TPE60491.1 alpha/beta hydrolase [Sandaracinobacter neustonicus]